MYVIFSFSLYVFIKTRLNFKRFPDVNFCHISQKFILIPVDPICIFCHTLKYFFDHSFVKYFKHNTEMFSLRTILNIFCNIVAEKICFGLLISYQRNGTLKQIFKCDFKELKNIFYLSRSFQYWSRDVLLTFH